MRADFFLHRKRDFNSYLMELFPKRHVVYYYMVHKSWSIKLPLMSIEWEQVSGVLLEDLFQISLLIDVE